MRGAPHQAAQLETNPLPARRDPASAVAACGDRQLRVAGGPGS